MMRIQRRAAAAVATGTLTGLFGGMTGVGGGAIIVPMMVSLLGLTQHKAHGTSLSVMVLVGLVGAVEYVRLGYMDVGLAAGLTAGSMIGVVVGARTMNLVPADHLRRIFGIFLVLVGLRMLLA